MKVSIFFKNILFVGLIFLALVILIAIPIELKILPGMMIDIGLTCCFIGFYFAGKDFCKGTFQKIEIGQIYKYYGQDKEAKVLFLSVHIHEDILINTADPSTPNMMVIQKPIIETLDFEQYGVYEGILFDEKINPGDLVEGNLSGTSQRGVNKKRI